MKIKVTTQAELDAALAKKGSHEIVCTGAGVFKVTDKATVWASGSATVTASDSATVTASGSATVTASGSATVTASGSATVWAAGYVAVHKLSKDAQVEGGVVIEPPDLTNRHHWLKYHGLVPRGIATVVLYKAVDTNFKSGYGFDYSPGATPVAHDYETTNAFGKGLHLSPSPAHALRYMQDAVHFVGCVVEVESIVPITEVDGSSDKCKVARVLECFEVTIHGERAK